MKYGEVFESCDIFQPYTADSALTDRAGVVFGATARHVDFATYSGQQCAGITYCEGDTTFASGFTRVALFKRGIISVTAGESVAQGDYAALYSTAGRFGKWLPGYACCGIWLRTATAGQEGLLYFDISFQTSSAVSVIATGAQTADFSITTHKPAGDYAIRIVYEETAGAAVTGGLDVGTTASGEEIMSQQTCNASTKYNADFGQSQTTVAPYFTLTANDLIYFSAHTAWNAATVKAWVILTQLA
jgi:hypothetical protein